MNKRCGVFAAVILVAVSGLLAAQQTDVELVPVRMLANVPGSGISTMWGYIDLTGRRVIQPMFTSASWFTGEVAVASVRDARDRTRLRYGSIDPQGRWILPAEYDGLRVATDDPIRLWALRGDGWVLIDLTGSELSSRSFGEVSRFSESRAVVRFGEQILVVDESGRTLFSITDLGLFSPVPAGFGDGLLALFRAGAPAGLMHLSFVDGGGKIVIPERTYLADRAPRFSDGFAAVQEFDVGRGGPGEAYFVGTDGRRAFAGAVWAAVRPFSEGLAAVAIDVAPGDTGSVRRWGFIDGTGEYVVVPTFAEVQPFHEGLAAVAIALDSSEPGNRKARWGAIDRSGKMVIEPRFQTPFQFYAGSAFMDEPYLVTERAGRVVRPPLVERRLLYINRDGEVIWDELERIYRPLER